jgi:DNA-binding GntR family transcriptional regulator
MIISRDSEVPPYQQLAAILRERIADGTYTARLPGERQLAGEFDVAVVTARKAVHLLRDEGLVRTSPGMGNYIVRQ